MYRSGLLNNSTMFYLLNDAREIRVTIKIPKIPLVVAVGTLRNVAI